MLKNTLTALLIGTTMFALAQAGGDSALLAGTSGKAGLGSQDRREANVDFHVGTGYGKERELITRGRLNFEQRGGQNARPVAIHAERIAQLQVDGNKAKFAGRAILVTMVDGQRKRIPGTIEVHVVDNKRPNQQGNDVRPDVFAVKFKAAEGDLTFGYEGAARRGDLKVWKKQS